jgi:hypothetical protein
MSMIDRGSALAVAPGGLRVQSREHREWHGGRCTRGVQGSGKYAFEATVTDEGLCRVGWSTLQANLDLGTCKSVCIIAKKNCKLSFGSQKRVWIWGYWEEIQQQAV